MKILIKLSGKIIDDKNELKQFITSIKKIYKKDQIIIVHGGGKQVSSWSEKVGLETKFVNGLRFTDEKTLEVVIAVLCGIVNKQLVFEFIKNKMLSVGISCIDGKLVETNIETELGFVGKKVKQVNTKLIDLLLKQKFIVVVSSIGIGEDKIVNINADNVTYALAKKLKVDKLFFLTDKEGVLDKDGNVIRQLKIGDIDKLIETGVVTEGMIPKLAAIKDALNSGVKNVVISNRINIQGTVVKK
ncbi:MAG: acetylglutamate kinase [Endomicrobiia bacterium]